MHTYVEVQSIPAPPLLAGESPPRCDWLKVPRSALGPAPRTPPAAVRCVAGVTGALTARAAGGSVDVYTAFSLVLLVGSGERGARCCAHARAHQRPPRGSASSCGTSRRSARQPSSAIPSARHPVHVLMCPCNRSVLQIVLRDDVGFLSADDASRGSGDACNGSTMKTAQEATR